MTVKEQIEYLQTLPQDLEVWHCWDESGECFPTPSPRGEILYVKNIRRRDKRRWEEDYVESNEGKLPLPGSKKVVMI